MVALSYVGRNPNNSSALGLKGDTDVAGAASVVTSDYVTTQTAATAAALRTKSYVDTQDALRVTQGLVNSLDAAYLASTARGAPSGVASLDGFGDVLSAQVPTGVPVDRVFKCYCLDVNSVGNAVSGAGVIGENLLGEGQALCTLSGTPRDADLAHLPIPDPGWPYRILPFAWIKGWAEGDQPDDLTGTGNYGLLTVMAPTGSTIYGLGLGTGTAFLTPSSPGIPPGGNYGQDQIPVTPYAAINQTPTSVAPNTGAIDLHLYGSLWSGSDGFTFYGHGMAFMALIFPAL